MQDTFEFIKKYGSLTFDEMPFNEVDNLNLCQMFYMPIEKVSPQTFSDEPKLFADVSADMFSFNGNKHVAPGLVLNKKISRKMTDMAATERYAGMKVYAVRDVYREKPAVQFCAGTFVLCDGTIVVVFRGTDDTIVGWKEDADILLKGGIPSHQLAVDYLKDVNEAFPEGNIIICGHSKGGNVALYGALASEKPIRERIVALYNNEGPGFDTYAWFSTPQYKELLPRYHHYVPSSSMIGMMLAHDNDYKVIKSKLMGIGLFQHDISFWRTSGDKLQQAKQLSPIGKVTDRFLNKFIFGIDERQQAAFEKVVDSVVSDGIAAAAHGLIDVPKNIPNLIKEVSASYNSVDEEDRDVLRGYLGGTLRKVSQSIHEEAKEQLATRKEEWEAQESDGSIKGRIKAAGEKISETIESVKSHTGANETPAAAVPAEA